MCGIAGIIKLSSKSGIDTSIESIVKSLHSRGPDGAGLWSSPDCCVYMGHTRLAILDLSSDASQPMFSEDGQSVFAYNGEIYNFDELKRKLIEQGQTFLGTGDTEVLFRCLLLCGERSFAELQGMFALALHDINKGVHLLARDSYGMKPLYFRQGKVDFTYSSTVKSFGLYNSEKSLRAQISVGMFGFVTEPDTIDRNISAFKPGTYMKIRASAQLEVQKGTFWAHQPISTFSTSLDSLSYIGENLKQTIENHFISDVPVGIMLSSGVDSAIIAAAASWKASITRVYAFTIVFEDDVGTAHDERVLASELAKSFGLIHITEVISNEDLLESFPKIASDMDQPSIDGINTWFVSRLARRYGVKVLISGSGGDELLGGYKTFKLVPWMFAVRKFIPNKLGRILGQFLLTIGKLSIFSRFRNILQRTSLLLMMQHSIVTAYLIKRMIWTPFELEKYACIPFIRSYRYLRKYIYLLGKECCEANNENVLFNLETEHYLKNQLLRDADWAGMAHSVEIRTPYCDIKMRNLVNAQSLPLKERRVLKYKLARLYFGLPSAVYDRKKTGFSTPISRLVDGLIGGNYSGDTGLTMPHVLVSENFTPVLKYAAYQSGLFSAGSAEVQ